MQTRPFILFNIILRRPHVFWHPLIATLPHISQQGHQNIAYFPLSLFICPSLCILAKAKHMHCIVPIISLDRIMPDKNKAKCLLFLQRKIVTNLDFENLNLVLTGFLTILSTRNHDNYLGRRSLEYRPKSNHIPSLFAQNNAIGGQFELRSLFGQKAPKNFLSRFERLLSMSGSKFLRGVTKVDCGAHNHDNGQFNKDRNLEDHVSSIDNVSIAIMQSSSDHRPCARAGSTPKKLRCGKSTLTSAQKHSFKSFVRGPICINVEGQDSQFWTE